MSYQPKTGQQCHCKPGQHRDNCPDCEGTGWRIDFRAIRFQSDLRRAINAAIAHLDSGTVGISADNLWQLTIGHIKSNQNPLPGATEARQWFDEIVRSKPYSKLVYES